MGTTGRAFDETFATLRAETEAPQTPTKGPMTLTQFMQEAPLRNAQKVPVDHCVDCGTPLYENPLSADLSPDASPPDPLRS